MGIDDLQPLGKEGLHFFHLGPHGIRRVQCVGARCLSYGHPGRRLAVVLGFDIVELGPELGTAYVTHTDDRTVRIDADRDRCELLWGLEHVLDHNRGVQALSFHRGRAAELSC